MADALWLVVAAMLCFGGMGWLALAMDVHWQQVMHRPPGPAEVTRRVLRVLGAVALTLALLACLAADRPSMAVLVWVMLMAGSAVLVAMTLGSRPQLLRVLHPLRQV